MRWPAYALPLLLLIGCGSCGSAPTPDPAPAPKAPPEFEAEPAVEGLLVTLTDAEPLDQRPDPVALAPATVLSDDQTSALLSRIPDLEIQHGDRTAFALRKGSLPPPRTGETVSSDFPPAPDVLPPDPGEADPLQIVRYAPEGDVPVAPKLSVSFNHPMIALTSQDEAAKIHPVQIEPEPPGQWRWIGTKTLLFEPDARFPMSTDYTVTVLEGTKSAIDGSLGEAKEWKFSTPNLSIEQAWPNHSPVGLEPLIYVHFNQRIGEEVFTNLSLTAGDHSVPLVRASDEDIAADPQIKSMVANATEDRWLVVKPTEKLTKATSYKIGVASGTHSAEGPKPTTYELSRNFSTYHPLTVERYDCGYGKQACPPYASWWVVFNNPLDHKVFNPSAVKVDPEIPNGISIRPNGNQINFDGHKPGSRRYNVTIPANLTDSFGQTLGKDEVVHFNVGKDEPSLRGAPTPMVVLDPDAPPGLSVYSTNHERLRLRVYKVKPSDWGEMHTWWQEHNNDYYHNKDLPGERLADRTLKVGGDVDAMVETVLDLQPYVSGEHAQLMVWVTPTRPPRDAWNRQEVIHWVQVTDIGLTAMVDQDEMYAWANQLSDGKPLEGVELSIHPKQDEASGASNKRGMATLKLPESGDYGALLVASKGDDLALLPNNNNWWRSYGWYKQSIVDQIRWFVFDDRGMYKPGETVTIKGWMRRFEPHPTGDIASVGEVEKVTWKLKGPRGNDVAEGEAEVSALGGFDFEMELPDNINLGQANLHITAVNAPGLTSIQHYHPVQIQEFRRPEFEVSVTVDPGPHLLGDHVHASVSASYYAGGGLPNAETNWSSSAVPATYTPPNRSEYTFGRWTSWWGGWFWQPPTAPSPGAYLNSKTDARGVHDLDVHLKSLTPPRPMTLHLNAGVVDVNRQSWAASSQILVHPSALYVGLKSEKSFVEKGDSVDVDIIVSDIAGEIVGGQAVELRMARLEWGRDDSGSWSQQEQDPQPCKITSAQTDKPCSFTTKRGGEYQVTARVVDDEGRPNETTLRIWVSGEEQPPQRGVGQDQITLVPSAKEYAAGDVAKVYVQAPFAPAEGVLSYRRSGMLHHESFSMTGATTTLEIPITDAHTPNLFVQVDLVGKKMRTDDEGKPREDLAPRPAFASGSLNLPVPPVTRSLSLEVVPQQDAVAPGGETVVDITITDNEGKPVSGGEVVVVVVDESVLALSGYKLTNPVETFYANRGPGVSDYHLRSQIILAQAALVTASGSIGGATGLGGMGNRRGGDRLDAKLVRQTVSKGARAEAVPSVVAMPMEEEMDMDKSEVVDLVMSRGKEKKDLEDSRNNGPAIAMRTDFSALAVFEPDLKSNAEGKLSVPIKLPDSLTRYRIMVVAVNGGKQFGKGESGLTARNPVMVRPSAPRFLNFGDRAEFPVVVQNQTDKRVTVDVAMRATNALMLAELPFDPRAVDVKGAAQAGRRIQVAANDRAEIRFPMAADMAGTARFQIAISSGDFSDATELSVPVWTPATSEAFATYGEIDDGAIVQPVSAPPDVWPQFGGLEITTSSTALQALTDAVIYLSEYPFSCNEQLGSRVLAIAALRDVLDAFDADGLPESKELIAQVERDLEQLAARQDYNGGWGFWRRGDPDWAYLTIHVAHASARAESKGFTINANMRNRELNYLKNIEQHIPHWYDIRYRRMLISYSLYVRELLGDHDGKKARKLYRDAGLDGLSLEAQGWLLHVLHADGATAEVDQIVRHWGNNVTETAGAANFVTSYDDDAAHVILHSDRRVDGVLLEALVKVRPKDTLIPKVVRGLLAHRKRGRWGNTQENAFVLLAMDAYFHEFESQTPDFVARAWLGDGFAGEHAFAGRTTERHRIEVPMGYLTETKGPQDLTLQKDGTGRLYYRMGMKYAPKNLELAAADRGFTVQRTYEPIDDDGDVVWTDGLWKIKAGSRVRVKVTMVATGRRYHVALVDPLPAGLEPMNPALKVTGALPKADPKSQGRYWWWSRTWYEHENMRDERVEAFTSLLWAGVHEYTYVARATTPGQFVVPPPRAEEMYSPETFGRGKTVRVVID